MEDVYDITIIGGGPAGLYALYYAGFRSMKAKLIDSLPELGGQVAALYPEKYIYDVAGFPKILGRDLVKNFVAQALQYDPRICLGERVIDLQIVEDRLIKLTTDVGREHLTKTVLLTVGVGAFEPKKLGNPSVERFEGRGVLYFVKEMAPFRDKEVLVVGGGDSAVDWALNLVPLAKKITLIHRRDQFRAREDSVRKLFESPVDVKLFHEVKEARGNEALEEVTIFHNKTKEELTLPANYLILSLGFHADLGPVKEWGIETEGNSIKVNSRMETSVPGVYAAGDVATYPGKVKLISTGTGEAAIAVNNAKVYIDPKARVFPGHSSELVQK